MSPIRSRRVFRILFCALQLCQNHYIECMQLIGREGYSHEESIPEPSPEEKLLQELDAEARDIKRKRSLKIVRPSNVRGPERQVEATHPEKERNVIVRFEREEILRIYKMLREKGAHATESSKGESSLN